MKSNFPYVLYADTAGLGMFFLTAIVLTTFQGQQKCLEMIHFTQNILTSWIQAAG
jgi:hypothetical protein